MTSKLSRRGFLVSLIALGATYLLPEDATAEQVDQIWEEALKTPWYFEVNEWGTITEPDAGVAQRWGDVFEDIWPDDMETYRDVISTVDACVPLQSHFTVLASDEADRLAEIPPRQLGPKGRKLLASLEEDAFDGWRVWVKSEGDAGVARFRAAIEDWLQQPADAAQIAWFPVGYGAQGQAMAFFERVDWDERNALGVVIIEGDHPGSTYYAAELKASIADANETAEALKLPFRFRPEGSA